MRVDEIRMFYEYHYWANNRIMDAAAQLAPEQLSAPVAFSHASLRGILVHLFSAEWVWRTRCQEEISPRALPAEERFETFDAVRELAAGEEAAMRHFLAGLDDATLDTVISYATTSGKAYATPLWQILMQIITHGTQHRSEAAVLLTQYGTSPGDLDFIKFARE